MRLFVRSQRRCGVAQAGSAAAPRAWIMKFLITL
jgi:hypothetical protein